MCYNQNTITKINEFISDYIEELNCKRLLYNPFNCLTRHHLEELHSKFIKNLLDPSEKHNFKNGKFLKAFFELPIIKKEIENFDNLDFKNAIVTREFIIPENINSYGRIDILIEFNDLVIAIENKIDAKEQDKQIKRYDEFLKTFKKNYKVIYLTLDGKFSNESEDAKYICISYKTQILEWLEKCKEIAKDYKYVESGIHFYSQTIKKILNMEDKEIEIGIASIIKSDIDFLKNINKIEKAIPIIQRDFVDSVFKKLTQKFNYELIDGGNWIQLSSKETFKNFKFAIASDFKEKFWFGLNGTNDEFYEKLKNQNFEFADLMPEWHIVKIKYIDFSRIHDLDNFANELITEIEDYFNVLRKKIN